MISRRNFLKSVTLSTTGIATSLIIGTLPVLAKKSKFFTGLKSGYGAAGYDVVAYFTQKQPIKGKTQYETTWQGVKWAFSNQENLDKFTASPEKYAPQYGGYCAYAVSKGYTAKGDPNAWTVHDGKLYLNYSDQVRGLWLSNRDSHIKSANQNWPKVLN
jgi:YHS domain-containing protein